MSRSYHLTITEEQKKDLEYMQYHDPLPYIRVKAAGILKVAAGQMLKDVAATGVVKAMDPRTVRRWCERYKEDGRDGLLVQAGRGRKPAFSPCAPGSRNSSRRGPRDPLSLSAPV